MTRIPRQALITRIGRILPVVVAVALNVDFIPGSRAGDAPSAGDAKLFDRLDTDRNGVITTDEVAPENLRLFDRLLRQSDANHDKALSRGEFLAALVPSRPEKPIEAKQPATSPQADAVRYLLLAMDTNRNSTIEPDEVPKAFKPAFEFMVDRLDRNNNGKLDRYELSRGGPPLAVIAARYVQREGINPTVELAKLEKLQGKMANRFDEQPMPLESLRDPQKARQLFAQLDQNGDHKVERKEMPEPLQQPLERFLRMADRDGDGQLSEREFLDGAERLSKFLKRPQTEARRERKSNRPTSGSKPAKSTSTENK